MPTRHRLVPSLLALLAVAGSCPRAAADVRVASPDGAVQIRLLADDPRLECAVTFRGKPVLEPSPLLMTVDGVDVTEGARLADGERYQVNETYPTRGVHARAVNRCNGLRIPVRHEKSGTAYTLDVRAFNDAVAFRYVVPGEGRSRVPDEASTFRLPDGGVVWYHGLRGHYEGNHTRKGVSEVQAGEWAAPPLTFKLPGGAGYASITEADLVNYPGMAFQADGRRGFRQVLGPKQPVSHPFELRYQSDIERLAKPAAVSGTITTPWRVVMVGPDLNTLVNCDAVANLSPPPDPKYFPKGLATDWVKPGRAVWNYLDGGAKTIDGAREFCRLAGELGFEYLVIEGYWERWSDAEIKELVKDADRQHVGLWVWKHTKQLRDPAARQKFFQRCHDVGVRGVKLDFFDHEAKEVVDLYPALLREAAERHLLVNFHGSNKPTGEYRTWPNELTREAVRGMESRGPKARHDVALPFTRFLAGPADYTPVHFGERRTDTTWAHQIASAAVFTSPLLTYAANPANILKNPGVDMMKSIPAVWDETVVLPPSEVGEVAAFARRCGNTWFLAALNGPEARTVKLPLAFLGPGDYRALLVRDTREDAAAVRVENSRAKRDDTLAVELREGGGFIARFSQD